MPYAFFGGRQRGQQHSRHDGNDDHQLNKDKQVLWTSWLFILFGLIALPPILRTEYECMRHEYLIIR